MSATRASAAPCETCAAHDDIQAMNRDWRKAMEDRLLEIEKSVAEIRGSVNRGIGVLIAVSAAAQLIVHHWGH